MKEKDYRRFINGKAKESLRTGKMFLTEAQWANDRLVGDVVNRAAEIEWEQYQAEAEYAAKLESAKPLIAKQRMHEAIGQALAATYSQARKLLNPPRAVISSS